MISKSTITIDEVIARSKVQLRIGNTSEHDAYLEMMISEGLRHLDAISLYVKKQCSLDIVDNKAELPKGFMKLLALRFSDTITVDQVIDGVTTEVPLVINTPLFYVDTAWLNIMGCDTTSTLLNDYLGTFQIVNGFIHFNSNNIESGLVDLAYMGLNTDDNDRLLIYEEYERGLSAYACYMFTLAFADDRGVGISDRYYETWKAQKAWIKGGAFKDQFQKTKMEISAAVNAIVVDQTVNWA